MTNIITNYVYKDGKHLPNLDRRSHWGKTGTVELLRKYLEELSNGERDWESKTTTNSDGTQARTVIKARYGDITIKTVFEYET